MNPFLFATTTTSIFATSPPLPAFPFSRQRRVSEQKRNGFVKPFYRQTQIKSLFACCSGGNVNNSSLHVNQNLIPTSFPKLNSYTNDYNDEKSVTNNFLSRLERLVNEFKSLAQPIDRVKRLLYYASRLPPFDEEDRTQENRVPGCTTQVWIKVEIDGEGRVRFRGDSDSEITKGFVSCLVRLLDGARPEEVAAVKAEELSAMNVGLYGKAQSRVNAWHNVLLSMQKRTLAVVSAHANGKKWSFPDNKVQQARWHELDARVGVDSVPT